MPNVNYLNSIIVQAIDTLSETYFVRPEMFALVTK